jgi:hypothetical protein
MYSQIATNGNLMAQLYDRGTAYISQLKSSRIAPVAGVLVSAGEHQLERKKKKKKKQTNH